jgi:hypothetical protein
MTTPSTVRYETQDELASEPIRGLPEMLPRGERILWQGAPAWRGLAISAYHAREAALYFGLLLAVRLASGIVSGEAALSIATSLLVFTGLAAAAVATLTLLGYLAGRTTVYTITNRRLVMRIGIALPMTLNLPFKVITSAASRQYGDGTADIPLQLAPENRLAFLILWPHCRPWHMRRPEPMLRRVPDGARVAMILADALKAYTLAQAADTSAASRPAVSIAQEGGREPALAARDTVAA